MFQDLKAAFQKKIRGLLLNESVCLLTSPLMMLFGAGLCRGCQMHSCPVAKFMSVITVKRLNACQSSF